MVIVSSSLRDFAPRDQCVVVAAAPARPDQVRNRDAQTHTFREVGDKLWTRARRATQLTCIPRSLRLFETSQPAKVHVSPAEGEAGIDQMGRRDTPFGIPVLSLWSVQTRRVRYGPEQPSIRPEPSRSEPELGLRDLEAVAAMARGRTRRPEDSTSADGRDRKSVV